MEGDSDTNSEMADYGTDFSDDVDRNFDAKARPQQGTQGSTVEILSHWQVPTSATSNLAQSREAHDSCGYVPSLGP